MLQTVAASQRAYASSCGSGGYAVTFSVLNLPFTVSERNAIRRDSNGIASTRLNGYDFTLSRAENATEGSPHCHGRPTHTAYVFTAQPVMFGISGIRSFAVKNESGIWQVHAATAPVEPFTLPAVPVNGE